MTDYTKLIEQLRFNERIDAKNWGNDDPSDEDEWKAADAIEALQAEIERERKSRQDAQSENEALKARLASAPLPKTPLDDAQIFEISRQWSNVSFARSSTRFCTDFARAIERAHGIE